MVQSYYDKYEMEIIQIIKLGESEQSILHLLIFEWKGDYRNKGPMNHGFNN